MEDDGEGAEGISTTLHREEKEKEKEKEKEEEEKEKENEDDDDVPTLVTNDKDGDLWRKRVVARLLADERLCQLLVEEIVSSKRFKEAFVESVMNNRELANRIRGKPGPPGRACRDSSAESRTLTPRPFDSSPRVIRKKQKALAEIRELMRARNPNIVFKSDNRAGKAEGREGGGIVGTEDRGDTMDADSHEGAERDWIDEKEKRSE